jgi:hypothetical protein
MKCLLSTATFEWCCRILEGVKVNLPFRVDFSTQCLEKRQLTIISYTNMPSVHQSTALSWYCPTTISGAIYSSVPTKELVRSVWTQDRVFRRGYCHKYECVLLIMTTVWNLNRLILTAPRFDPFCKVGCPQTSFLAKSKSLNTMCPDSCNKTSGFKSERRITIFLKRMNSSILK